MSGLLRKFFLSPVHRRAPRFLTKIPNQMAPQSHRIDLYARAISSSNALWQSETSEVGEKLNFQAETKQLLDIVTHSLYTDKEVFIRELISNASDALEKLRHEQVVGKEILNSEEELAIRIETDKENNLLTISDSGIGLTKEEMIDNLGTIAKSGSRSFIQDLLKKGKGDASTNIIGQFGVGFYSAFMVAKDVDVWSQSFQPDSRPHCWTSDGSGTYMLRPVLDQKRGTKIIMKLKEGEDRFADAEVVERIIKKYSNFVNFPIYLNGKKVNTIQAIWAMDKNSVSDEQYQEFYKYIANSYDSAR